MDEKRQQEIKNEMAGRVIDACGSTGVLAAVDNNKLKGDVKVRHQKTMTEAKKVTGRKKRVDPNVQAIFARLYGLI